MKQNQDTQNTNTNKVAMHFAAINPYIEENIIKADEKEINGQQWVQWGTKNIYPMYMEGLYKDVPTLQSIINGTTDFVVGDGVSTSNFLFEKQVNSKGETIEELVNAIVKDLLIYGCFAINVLRNKLGNVAELHYLNAKYVRSDKNNEWFYYSKDFASKSSGRCKCTVYPKFDADAKDPSSVFFFKTDRNSVYGTSVWASATIAAELQKKINEYHINNINNNFSASFVVNMNNGVPTDEVREEIEEAFDEKFCGVENSGRFVLTFNNDKDHACTIEKVDSEDYGDKYATLSKRSQNELFVAFGAHPVLFGLPTENSGFNDQDFSEAFKLYNRVKIRPLQKKIGNCFDKILGGSNVLNIKPFSIDWSDDEEETVVH